MKDIRAYSNKISQASLVPSGTTALRTDVISFLNLSGKRIVGYCDGLDGAAFSKGLIIVPPPYGKTKSSDLPLAYYLALNGFQVLRYDHSNHVGESDGSMLFASLSQMAEDLVSAIDFAQKEYGASRVTLASSSLGLRVALKVACRDQRVNLLIGLVGVFNLQQTLCAMYREDGVEKTQQGVSLGLRDILGFQIDADLFLSDAIRANFHSLDSSLEDAAGLCIPAVFFAADKDPWVSLEEVRRVFDRIPTQRKELHLLRNTMHEIYENPVSADHAFRKVVSLAEKYLLGNELSLEDVETPGRELLTSRSREEKARARAGKELHTEEEKIFWKTYLEKYSYIVNLQDYWNLLDFLSQLLGDWKRGDRILDVGCGIGNLGTFILVRRLYHLMQGKASSFQKLPLCRYFGVDFVDEAIRQARNTHERVQQEFKQKLGLGPSSLDLVNYFYLALDLNQPVPIKGRYFDKICCNLVLSYLDDPSRTLKDIFRTLKTGGRIVVTSLKPYADLSQIYRDFIQVSRTPEELDQARLVLNNAGMIKHKEAEGYYQFFSEAELRSLLTEVGASNIQVFRSFGDQANVAVAERSP
jgi:SAM-dependent methyltransferase/alpha-beta hydrolase superfamily lysophospholipase